ncbi:hypothetical protein [Bacillus nitratireducens]|uniref:hypothetical protein n=1 Tax=Bacillus nitratireducens TaxID=2026193 RepID=UPI002E1A286D|nr:hypothetical protein [Bacillus nitratireducens]
MPKLRLIPFDLKHISRREHEIPEGVKMIKAPNIWEHGSEVRANLNFVQRWERRISLIDVKREDLNGI